jgi:carboxylesterase type B
LFGIFLSTRLLHAYSQTTLFQLYLFKNIRFAAAPTGPLRFAAPQAPVGDPAKIHDGKYGHHCPQSITMKSLNLLGPGNNSPVGAALNQFLGGIPIPLFKGAEEDCLFLDLHVPGKALRGEKKDLPVVVWIYGGGYSE